MKSVYFGAVILAFGFLFWLLSVPLEQGPMFLRTETALLMVGARFLLAFALGVALELGPAWQIRGKNLTALWPVGVLFVLLTIVTFAPAFLMIGVRVPWALLLHPDSISKMALCLYVVLGVWTGKVLDSTKPQA